MRYAILLSGLLVLGACTDGDFGSPPPEEALVTPGDCYDPAKSDHPEWDVLCGHEED